MKIFISILDGFIFYSEKKKDSLFFVETGFFFKFYKNKKYKNQNKKKIVLLKLKTFNLGKK